eukprot:scaffold98974_cov32-Tisochrysis_lutea.AAC.5
MSKAALRREPSTKSDSRPYLPRHMQRGGGTPNSRLPSRHNQNTKVRRAKQMEGCNHMKHFSLTWLHGKECS